MRRRKLLVFALLAGALMGSIGSASAQCAPPLSVDESLASAETAFIGRVIDRSNLDRTAVFQVLEVWKGRRLSEQVVVNGGPEDPAQQTSIDRRFLLGQIYLVLPANARPPFRDSLCTGTQLWSTPTGQIPAHLQEAVGGTQPIQVLAPQFSGGPVQGPASATGDEGMDPIAIAMVAVGVAFLAVFIGRRVGPIAKRRREREIVESRDGSLRPEALRRKSRRRRVRRFAMPGFIESKRVSRIEQVRKSNTRFKRGADEHQKERLATVVKLTATHPPKRKNHYTSGRRAAP